jgi:hypothetical protein
MCRKLRESISAGFLFIIAMNGVGEFIAAAGLQLPHTETPMESTATAEASSLAALVKLEEEAPPCHREEPRGLLASRHCSDCGVACNMGEACDCASMSRPSGRPDGIIFAAPGCRKDAEGRSLPVYPASAGFVFGFSYLPETRLPDADSLAMPFENPDPNDFHPSPRTPPPESPRANS